MTIFDGLMNGVSKVLVILAVLMVISFIVLVFLTILDRSKMSLLQREDELDDYLDDINAKEPRKAAYSNDPDPDEIRYTQRMLAQKDDKPYTNEPIRLPPPAVMEEPQRQYGSTNGRPDTFDTAKSMGTDTVKRGNTGKTFLQDKKQPLANEMEEKLPKEDVDTGKKDFSFPEKAARTHTASPRVFDYRKQPKRQPVEKKTVTHVSKNRNFYDDEE